MFACCSSLYGMQRKRVMLAVLAAEGLSQIQRNNMRRQDDLVVVRQDCSTVRDSRCAS